MLGESRTATLFLWLLAATLVTYAAAWARAYRRRQRVSRAWRFALGAVVAYTVAALQMLLSTNVAIGLFEVGYHPFSSSPATSAVRVEALIHWPVTRLLLALAYPGTDYLDMPLLWPWGLFIASISTYGLGAAALAVLVDRRHRRGSAA